MYNFVRLKANLKNWDKTENLARKLEANFGKYEKMIVDTFLEVQYF